MKLIGTGRLKRDGVDWTNVKWVFCGKILKEYFDIPKGTESVWLIAHSSPTADSYPVTVTSDFQACVQGPAGAIYYERILRSVVRSLKERELLGTLLHVECFYK